jgi:hypothetical protein
VQLVTEGEVLQFQNGPTAESASKNRDDGTPELMHAGDTTADHRKTLDFSALSEFLVATVAGMLTLLRSIVSVLACRFCSRAVLELENLALRAIS